MKLELEAEIGGLTVMIDRWSEQSERVYKEALATERTLQKVDPPNNLHFSAKHQCLLKENEALIGLIVTASQRRNELSKRLETYDTEYDTTPD